MSEAPHKKRRHHLHSSGRRALYSFFLIFFVMLIGTLGMHRLEDLDYLDAFYFMSMIATSQGPILTPQTAAGKIFASCMAFVSVGAIVAAFGFLFGPFFGSLWKIGVDKLEEELRHLAKKSQ